MMISQLNHNNNNNDDDDNTTIIVAYFIIYKCFTYYNPSTLHGLASGPAQLDLDLHPWMGPYMASDPRPDSILVP